MSPIDTKEPTDTKRKLRKSVVRSMGLSRVCRTKDIDICNCALASVHCQVQTARRESWFKFLKAGSVEKLIEVIIETELHRKSTADNDPTEHTELLRKAETDRQFLSQLPSSYDFLRIFDDDRCATLQCAVRLQKLEVLNFLLELLKPMSDRHIILNAGHFSDNSTPLMDACSAGNLQMVQALHAAGAKWFLKNAAGVQAHQMAEKAGHLDVAEFYRHRNSDGGCRGRADSRHQRCRIRHRRRAAAAP
eukprot:CAMPEP_0172165602 /NCGR_PEP_ID=MMETSP1050-20130122/8505_1 /TAXON_ID=233186 /ORGANISM="Cryptomonas curvata, Strain CCAP979/52" /LENGTH=247 /DNA_ID=CAMNT_0012836095 /DNA_START=59 /DNA_END=798 /DNA_ORIENTATION=-